MEETSVKKYQLFAKLNGAKGKHLLVFSDDANMLQEAIKNFSKPTISHSVQFNPSRTLHDDEWYNVVLNDEQITEMINPYTSSATSNSKTTTITTDEYGKTAALYKTDGEDLIVNKITPSLRIERKTFIGMAEHPELVSYEHALEFTGRVDAYFDGSDKLYFKSYSTIRSLFKGIEVFYRDATAEEKQVFLQKSFLDVSGIDPEKIGQRSSAKIANILDDSRIKMDNQEFQEKVLLYAQEFVPNIVSDGKLKISDKETLHEALSVLTDSYYTSVLFGDKREAIDSAKIETI